MVVVDVDGLAPEAIAELVQGSRKVFIKARSTMPFTQESSRAEGDPDLKRLEAEAEQDIAELKAGDEAVRKQIGRFDRRPPLPCGPVVRGSWHSVIRFGIIARSGWRNDASGRRGSSSTYGRHFGTRAVLMGEPEGSLLRLHPGEVRTLGIKSILPKRGSAWNPRTSLLHHQFQSCLLKSGL